MSHPLPVRPATPQDIPQAVETLTDAFADYPFTRHTVSADGHRERVGRLQELFLVRVGMACGRVWVAEGGAAVAAWTTPERDALPALAEVAPLAVELAGDRAGAAEAAEAALAPHRPTEPTWFLATVGVAPAAQARGLGSAVLAPGLEAADRAGDAAFLETSSEANLRFYGRLGFAVTAEVELPEGGPLTWCMRREPNPG
ncbi:GNAT family N-acetyltransferase [Streptomyces xiaopingdaonensis]|uniref:GNAT family N-acetyltransferase n=1 Tax=Streptomyces xiaopingdaonensis TaxID=1565415 RepID=UPI0002E965F7|nr:GNAT family N-acetyltransferase [Streptomyces xiaopingdaonensis]